MRLQSCWGLHLLLPRQGAGLIQPAAHRLFVLAAAVAWATRAESVQQLGLPQQPMRLEPVAAQAAAREPGLLPPAAEQPASASDPRRQIGTGEQTNCRRQTVREAALTPRASERSPAVPEASARWKPVHRLVSLATGPAHAAD